MSSRSITEQRADVVKAAESWLRTPYAPHSRVRGVNGGADCATLLAGVYEQAGVIPHFDVEHYSQQWHLHHSDELYMKRILEYAHEIPDAPENYKPGNLVVFRFGRTYSHGAIVVQGPRIIHSFIGLGCSYDNIERNSKLHTIGEGNVDRGRPRPRKLFSLWED